MKLDKHLLNVYLTITTTRLVQGTLHKIHRVTIRYYYYTISDEHQNKYKKYIYIRDKPKIT